MMFPSLGLLLSALLLHVASGECPGERPTKSLLCYVQEIPSQFDPCLCTHLVLQTPLEKLTPQSELLKSARRLQERQPALRLILQAAESAEVALKKRGGYAQSVAAVVSKNNLDGVEVDLKWGKQLAAKVQLVDFIQSLSKELEKLEPKDRAKRDYKIYERIDGDTVTPKWSLQANRKVIRKTREAESSEDVETTTTTDETTTTSGDEKKEKKETESTQEIEEEEEEVEETRRQILLHLTSEPQHLAKNYDLKRLSKYVSLYTVASDNLTDSSEQGLAYHPSRLMGINDILNADSLIDLVTGLGAPHDKLVLTLPSIALQFTLKDKEKNMPRSAVTSQPHKLTRSELCKTMSEGEWTVERDEDLTAPYAYHDTTWLAFDDPTSVSIKGKYILLRDLAGAAVRDADAEDWASKCNSSGPVLIQTLHDTFTNIARRSRAAQLVSLQEQLHEAGQFQYSGDVHLSPYRIVRVVDREGSIHVVRKEAKTEFECSRQGYFRHPSGCNRFYRCVKFNQYEPDFTVFEYDCPAGLAFDETVEVCVWPGSLADGGACQGSSEIAPVPRSRYVCPQVAGYYADPENCRWFFACLDHQGDGSPLTAYEFRCPFGLVFDEQALVCNWPWLVPGCGGAGVYQARFTVGDFYEGRHRPSYASLSDVHVSGGRIENVPGGVVLGSAISGIGSGAYPGSYAAGSNALGSGAYSGAGDQAGTSYESNIVSGSGVGAGLAYSSGSGAGYAASGLGGAAGVYPSGASVGSGAYRSEGLGAYSSNSGAGYKAVAGSGGANAVESGAYSAGSGARLVGSGAYSAGLGAGLVGSGAYSTGSGAGLVGSGAYSTGSGAGLVGSGVYSAGSEAGVYSAGSGAGLVGSGGYSTDSGTRAYSTGSGAGLVGSGAYSAGSGAGLVGSGAYSASSDTGAYSAGSGPGLVGSGTYSTGSGVGVSSSTRYGAAGGSISGSQYAVDSGAYVEDNSGAYIHDPTGDTGGLYSGKASYGGQYTGTYVAGGAYVPGVYDNGAYKGDSSSGGQYKGSYPAAIPYSGSYDTGSYNGAYDSSGYSGKYDGGAYSGKYDGGAYSGKYDGGSYSGKYDGGAYSGKYDGGSYSGKYDGGAYSGKYDGGSYSGKYDGGAYSGSGKYEGEAYSGKYDGGLYSGKYDGGSYSGSSDSGAYRGEGSYSGSSSYQGGYKVPTTVVSDGAYGSHEYNSVNVIEHKPVVGLVGLDAVKVSGGDAHSGGYVSSYVTPSPLPAVSVTPVSPVVSSYSTVTPAPISVSTYTASTLQPTTPKPATYYPVSSTVTPVSSYSTVRPPIILQTYEQPSYIKAVTPAPAFSHSLPAVGVVRPAVPVNTYSYKQPIVKTEYVSGVQYSTPAPVPYEQQSFVKSVTPAPYIETASVGYAYQKPLGPAYLPPGSTYNYQPSQGQPVDLKFTYQKPAVLKTPIIPLNPVQYSTPAPIVYSATPVKPISFVTSAPVVQQAYTPTVLKTPVVPLNPVQYSTPSPVKTFTYSSTYSTPAPPLRYQPSAPIQPVRPIYYTSPAPAVSYEHSTPRPIQPVQPITYTTPAPAVSYEYSTPRPIQPVQPITYTNPAPAVSYEYSTPRPIQPVQPVTYTTPAPAVSYEYSTPRPIQQVRPYTYSAPSPFSVQYKVPTVLKAPIIPLNPVQYSTPAPVVYEGPKYLPPEPIQPVSYARPLKPITYTTPAPVKFEYQAPVAQPVIPLVAKTPVVPLNPIQYTTPTPPRIDLSYTPVQSVSYIKPVAPVVHSTPAPPPVRPVVYSTPAPPVIHHEYLTPISPEAPVVRNQYLPPVRHEYVAPVKPAVYKTPIVPLNPIQYTTPAPVVYHQSTPAPVVPLRPISYSTPAPPVSYLPPQRVEPLRPLRPVAFSTPTPQVVREYLPPAPVQPLRPLSYSTPAPAVVNYEYSAPALRPVVPTVVKAPVVPLNPIQYTTPAPLPVRPIQPIAYTTPAPQVNYQPVRPIRPITLSTPTPFSYDYQPVKSIPTVYKTPVVPLNPVQYTTPTPTVLQYSNPAPIQTVSYAKPLRPVTYTTQAPAVSYEYSTVAPVKYVKPVPTVLKTPIVPLNPVQYSTRAPVINQYSFGVAYQQPEIQYQPEVYQPQVVKSQVVQEGYGYVRPNVKFVDTPRIVSTTPAPVVTYSHATPEPTPIYKQVFDYVKAPVVSAYDKVLSAVSYSTTPAPLPVQPVTTSAVSYAPVNIGNSYNRPALVKTQSIPVRPIAVVPEYQKVLNVVKATTTPSPLYVNHYEPEIVPVSTPKPVVYRQRPIVVPETYVKDYSYEENLDEVYDTFKSDFGSRLTGYGQQYAYNQQKIVVPEVNVYTSSTPAPLPVVKEVTYKVRKPVKTYVQTYEQPGVAIGYEGGSYQGGSVYSTTPAHALVSSSEASFGEQYHRETAYKGYTGRPGDHVHVTPCDHVSHSPVITSTTPLPALPTIRLTTTKVVRPEGGYYVRKQKVRVRPVVTTDNYPQLYSSTYTPSTTVYSTTAIPKVAVSTTVHPDDEVDVEDEYDEEVKLLQGYNGQYGGLVEKGGYSVSSTVASIEDGEAVVGVLKKGRITYDGRRTKSKVVVVSKLSDFNPLLVGKLGAECSCDGKSNSLEVRTSRRRGSSRLFTPSRDSTVPDQQLSDTYLTSTTTLAPIVVNSYESSSDTPVVEIRPLRKKTRVYSTTTAEPGYDEEPGLNIVSSGTDRVKADSVQCNRAGLFRHPKKCNKFYSCNWDQWKKKFTLHEFKCPIHLAYDINLGACNWPSKGPACAEDSLLV